MGVLIKINDADFTNYVGIADYPIIPSLKNLYFMGGTEAETKLDKSGNGNTGTIVGDVTIGEKYATFSTNEQDRMTTQNLPASLEGVTAIAMFKKNGNRPIFSHGSTAANGSLQISPGRLIYISDTDTELRDIRYTMANSDNFYIAAWTISPSEHDVYVDRKNIGLSLIASGTGTGTNLKLYSASTAALKKLNVGGSYYSYGMTGALDISVCAFYDAVLTQQQIQDVIKYLRGFGEKQGFTIN